MVVDLLSGSGLLVVAGIAIWLFGRQMNGGSAASNAGLTLAVIGLIVMSGLPQQLGFGAAPLQVAPGAVAPGAFVPVAPATALAASCPNTLATNARCRVKDVESSTNIYLIADCYYLDGGGLLNITSATAAPGFGDSIALSCGKQYTPYALTTRGARNGGQGASFTASSDTAWITLESANASSTQVRVKDVTTDAFLNDSQGGNAFSDIPRAYHNSTSGSQSLVGADGYLEQEIWFRTNTTNTRYGGVNAQCGIALDADVAAWQQPAYLTLNGVALSESKSSLDSDDQLGVAGIVNGTAEYFYPFPAGKPVDDQTQILRYRIQAASGTNPSTDLLWTFECKGWTLNSRDPLNIRYAYFANDAGRNESTMLNQVVRIIVD